MPRLLKRTATAGLLAVFLLADPATPAYWMSSPARFPFAYMQRDCAPNDAVELDFYFTAKKSECGKYSEPFVKISIWNNLPKPATHSVEIRARDGAAVRCLRPGACEAATSVILRLDKFINEKSSSGEYELHFKDGPVERVGSMPHRAPSISSVVDAAGASSLGTNPARRAALLSSILLTVGLLTVSLAQTPAGDWRGVNPASLCITEGAIEKTGDHRLTVNVPKMRAYVNAWTGQSIEARFTYLGPTSSEEALGSGEMRRQFGFKLRAQDPCNLVYAMWRMSPEGKLVVSVKRNPNAHTSAECGNRGYENIKPGKSAPLPGLRPGDSHTLRAEMKKEELSIFVDDHEVWQGDVGADAAALAGRVGIRSDDVRLEFDLRTGPYEGVHPNYLRACRTSDSD